MGGRGCAGPSFMPPTVHDRCSRADLPEAQLGGCSLPGCHVSRRGFTFLFGSCFESLGPYESKGD